MNVSLLMLELREPFPAHRVSWRIARVIDDKGDTGKAQVLAYIDARDVMERLDYICGIGGWQSRYSSTQGKTVCDIGIKIDGEWIWKADGAGDTDIEAEKGALSDAFKRAAVRWGVGRYLYELGNSYAEVVKKGKTWFITTDAQNALERSLPSGGSLKMADARPLFSDLNDKMGRVTLLDELRAFGQAIKQDVLKLPAHWQDEIRQQYTAKYSTLAAKDAA